VLEHLRTPRLPPGIVRALRKQMVILSGKSLIWSRSDPVGLILHCTARQDFGARVIPDASAPVIDPRTKPASLPARRNEYGVRHFSPAFPSRPIGHQPRCRCIATGPSRDLRKCG
jgi:hypothetical protein